MNITILGAGSWGIGLATLLHQRDHTVALWEFDKKEAETLHKRRESPNKLPGVYIPDSIDITSDLTKALAVAEYAVCAVPAQSMRSAMKQVAQATDATRREEIHGWIIVAKGIEVETLSLMSDVVLEELPGLDISRIAVLSGPSHAEEVARHIPTTVVAASKNHELARTVQEEFSTETFRIYTNDDVVGVELAGSVKNVIALAAGVCDGLGLGDNTKGALLTRGLLEMTRLGKRMGAREETFSGLAGMGDLITTCISRHSRNRKFGELIGSGLSMKDALKQMVMVAEGVETTRSVYDMARKHDVDMPITEQIYLTLFEGKSAREAVRDLMTREAKPERRDM
ncbi:MAG: NAD(P)H-dependent glycerol-3-phosphate dehydrogenase [Chitinivibrionales bacterium]|nr:NAD(P)H-dependent glycerol-3-phosphate dehydrogenase [Chitinivibrionales bacterium]